MTSSPERPPGMTYAEYLTAWSALHGGYDPRRAGRLVRGWLLVAYTIGSRLGRGGVRPGTVTASGLLLCLAVPALIRYAHWGLLAAAVLVLLAAFVDGLDGAVAVITDRVTRLGYIYDSVADRVGEAAWLTALWLAGAPAWLSVAAGATAWLLEYLRARAASAPRTPARPAPETPQPITPSAPDGGGGIEVGVVTVGERPMRVSVAISGFVVAFLAGFIHTSWVGPVVTVAVAVWLGLSVVGFGQLAAALRR